MSGDGQFRKYSLIETDELEMLKNQIQKLQERENVEHHPPSESKDSEVIKGDNNFDEKMASVLESRGMADLDKINLYTQIMSDHLKSAKLVAPLEKREEEEMVHEPIKMKLIPKTASAGKNKLSKKGSASKSRKLFFKKWITM